MGESKIRRCDVGNLFMLSISAIFHNTNDANDGDRSLIKQSNFQFRVCVCVRVLRLFAGIPVLLGMSFSRH